MDEALLRERTQALKALAYKLGFELCGVTGTAQPEAAARYRAQMAQGFGADMTWLYEKLHLRDDVREVWPEAQSVIVLAVPYGDDTPGVLEREWGEDEAYIARYARGRDYHLVVRKMLVDLVTQMAADPHFGGLPSEAHRVFCDTGPVLEKAYAQAAGLGWIGKNSLLIHPGHRQEGETRTTGRGSYYHLAVILSPLPFIYDQPEVDHCGSCRRCMDACPTQAIVAPRVLDARKCIATWTIETAEPASVIEPTQIGPHAYGCDICQDVCPWNRSPRLPALPALAPRPENQQVTLSALEALDEESFKARFPKSAIRRVKPHQMKQVIASIRLGRSLKQKAEKA